MRVNRSCFRFPSQTPTAVYWSSGLNLVGLLAETVRAGAPPTVDRAARRAVVYQHLRALRAEAGPGDLAVVGVTLAGLYFGIAAAIFLVKVSDFHWPSVNWLFTVPKGSRSSMSVRVLATVTSVVARTTALYRNTSGV